ncbi:MAG: hypothetical protein D6698_12625 [Gammaproteobacteria bacterium]|nr:MAG: hypothetical protein D6698_12625 [Gammaproteobacteria bacterium]
MWKRIVIMSLAAFLSTQAIRAGESDSYAKLADILLHVGHYPSAHQRADLRAVMAADDSRVVHAIAMAINNMQHKTIAQEDREQLKTLLESEHVPKQARRLLDVMLKMNHKLSYRNKKELQAVIDGQAK